jgi:hypothetical protein
MAGKMTGFRVYAFSSSNSGQFKPKLVRAYGEGRAVGKAGGVAGDNPFLSQNNEAETSWAFGRTGNAQSTRQYEAPV